MIRVSICVPTYNRAALLGRMMPALLTAISSHVQSNQFEVCISDNGSTDDTPKVLDRIIAEYPTLVIRSIRQPSNLGFAGNFAAVVRLARGLAFAVLADDDELRPSALDDLFTAAKGIDEKLPLVLFDSLTGADAVRRKMQQ